MGFIFNKHLFDDLLLKLLAFFPMLPIFKDGTRYSPVNFLLGEAADLLSSSSRFATTYYLNEKSIYYSLF